MPGHHAIIPTDASIEIFPGCAFFGWIEKNNTSENDSIVYCQCIFLCSIPFSASELCSPMPVPILFIMSLKGLLVPSSVLISGRAAKSLCMNQMLLIVKHTRSLLDSSPSTSIRLKASAWVNCSPGV